MRVKNGRESVGDKCKPSGDTYRDASPYDNLISPDRVAYYSLGNAEASTSSSLDSNGDHELTPSGDSHCRQWTQAEARRVLLAIESL